MTDKKYDHKELCGKIKEVFPDIGECGIDLDVDYDEEKKAYVVNMKKGSRGTKTHLEQCVGLGIQIAQFKE